MNALGSTACLFTCLAFLLSGCISYTTLQTPDTLEPGKASFGIGAATSTGGGLMLEAGGRIGVVKNFDAGLKYTWPNLVVFDGKLQLVDSPVLVSADMAVSYFSTNDNETTNRATGLYPMILIGQRHWYAGLKGTYLSTSGSLDLFGGSKYSGSGWLGPTLVLGGWAGNDNVRFLFEGNIMFWRGGTTTLVPAVGLQFRI